MFGKLIKSSVIALVLALGIAVNSASAAGSHLGKPFLTMTKLVSSTGDERCTAKVTGSIFFSENDKAILNSNADIAYRLRVTVEAVDGAFAGGFEGVATDIPDLYIKGPVVDRKDYSRTDSFIPMSKCNEDPNNRDEFIARATLLDADGRVIDSAVSDQLEQQFE